MCIMSNITIVHKCRLRWPIFLKSAINITLKVYSTCTYESFFSPFLQGGKPELRRVAVPPHRFTPLKENWMKIFSPIVDHLKLQIRLNLKTRNVELKVKYICRSSIKLYCCTLECLRVPVVAHLCVFKGDDHYPLCIQDALILVDLVPTL